MLSLVIDHSWPGCSARSGIHVLLLSLLALPFVFAAAAINAFYLGTITWYRWVGALFPGIGGTGSLFPGIGGWGHYHLL